MVGGFPAAFAFSDQGLPPLAQEEKGAQRTDLKKRPSGAHPGRQGRR
jgi:hypothetical protein